MTLDDLWGHTSFDEKFVSSKCWLSWKYIKKWELTKKYIAEKDDFWNFMITSEVILYFRKDLRLHNVSIYKKKSINIGSWINVLERKKLKSQSLTVSQSHS